MLWKYLYDDNSIREAFTEYALIDNDNPIVRNNYSSCQSYDEVLCYLLLKLLVTKAPWPKWLGRPAPTRDKYLFLKDVDVLGLISV